MNPPPHVTPAESGPSSPWLDGDVRRGFAATTASGRAAFAVTFLIAAAGSLFLTLGMGLQHNPDATLYTSGFSFFPSPLGTALGTLLGIEGLAIVQGSSTIAKRYFTLGNYSKFVRPGYVAVDVVGNSNANVLISGYKGTDGTVVVVAVNKGTAAVTVPISITGGAAPAMMTPTVTSSSQNLAATTAVPVSGGSFTAMLGATSVTTFVGK